MGYCIPPWDPAAQAQDFERDLNLTVPCRGILGRLFGHKVRREVIFNNVCRNRCMRCCRIQPGSVSTDPGHWCSRYSAKPKEYV